MKSRNWWIGVTAGTVLGLGGVLVAEQATTEASAQSFSVTPGQLQINQRISQAAVRRSNESLNLLDPVRKSGAQDDAPGWGTTQIRDGAVTNAKLANGTVASEKLANPTYWAVVNADGTLARGNGATASAKVTADAGAYKVTFGRNIATCAYTATVGGSSTATPPIGIASVYQNPDPANNAVSVRTYADLTGDPVTGGADRGFHLTVSC